jgi:hypothetical protein
MIESSLESIKTKKVIGVIWYLHSKEVDAFIFKIRVGVVCDGDDKTT